MLSVVATPIGNLADITLRALTTLREADVVVCEDTRQTQKLLNHYEIKAAKLISFNAHSDERKVQEIIRYLAEGQNVALVSDAGTPGICDPGFKLVSQAVEQNLPVTTIPGANAAVAALAVSGFPMHNYLFLGFLPIKKGRQTLLTSLAENPYTIVFYESVHRLKRTLADLVKYGLGDRQMLIMREITKQFEQAYRGKIVDLEKSPIKLKGEFTLIIAPDNFRESNSN
ncbi:16S rRNA (cytidine(1402)-2'-O)-methyltransferase [Candidatus Gracilibacteria bacterium]|jgi:16S rRNA (cytidine1402-2'-O)-methyltransferase|nr:16S rRNA (cytidine(1402)-2'-O)-methyltransferase [Candidatus Gracilibacteria bacterium]